MHWVKNNSKIPVQFIKQIFYSKYNGSECCLWKDTYNYGLFNTVEQDYVKRKFSQPEDRTPVSQVTGGDADRILIHFFPRYKKRKTITYKRSSIENNRKLKCAIAECIGL